MIGLYVHIPFCRGRCPYCDFYAVKGQEEIMDRYAAALVSEIGDWGNKLSDKKADTLYIGGGSPSQMGGKRLKRIINAVKENFNFSGKEITVEINPSDNTDEILPALADCGVNRISLGMQSAVDEERRVLGRRASREDIALAVKKTKELGLENISVDLMLGVPGQSLESLEKSLDFLSHLDIKHISFYVLTIEAGTYFYNIYDKLHLPEEDEICDMYLKTVEYLKRFGFEQYEISNLAKKGYESRHNLKYWHCEEYLGIGPSAHSFIDSKRFYYPRDIDAFVTSASVIDDGEGGSFEEYAMLALRLREGLDDKMVLKRFNNPIPQEIFDKARDKKFDGLVRVCNGNISLTPKGFLLSNSIINELINN